MKTDTRIVNWSLFTVSGLLLTVLLVIGSKSFYVLPASQYECQGRDVTPEGVRCLAYVSKHQEKSK